jgi:general secretion pathway protein C
MLARISAFVIWSLVAATAAFWLLRLTSSAPQAPAYAAAVGKSTVVRGDLNRLFGAAPVAFAAAEVIPDASSRFKLLGVMAPRSKEAQSIAGSGLALIAVDGKPAKAFTVGAPLDNGLVVQSVGLRTAAIGPAQGARSMLLELPALPPPATGVLAPSAGLGPQTAYSGSPLPSNSGAVPQGLSLPAVPGGTMRAPPLMMPVLPLNPSTPQFQAPPPMQSSPATPPSNTNDLVRSPQ